MSEPEEIQEIIVEEPVEEIISTTPTTKKTRKPRTRKSNLQLKTRRF